MRSSRSSDRPARPGRLRIGRALVRAGALQALAYRQQLAWLLLGALFPLILMTVWLSVVSESGPAAGWDRGDFVAYYIGAAVLFQFTNVWLTWQWDEDLRTGALSFRMLRPVPPPLTYVADEAGQRLVTIVALTPVVVAIAYLVPGVDYAMSPWRLPVVVLAVLGGFAVSAAMGLAFAMVSFWTTQTGNLYSLWWGGGAFLSGWIAPVEVLPDPARVAALVLPFRSVLGFPLEVLLGRLSVGETLVGFAVLAGWLAVFTAAAMALWRRGVRRHQAVGG